MKITIDTRNPHKRKRDDYKDNGDKRAALESVSNNSEDYQADHFGGLVVRRSPPGGGPCCYCMTDRCPNKAEWGLENLNCTWYYCTDCAHGAWSELTC